MRISCNGFGRQTPLPRLRNKRSPGRSASITCPTTLLSSRLQNPPPSLHRRPWRPSAVPPQSPWLSAAVAPRSAPPTASLLPVDPSCPAECSLVTSQREVQGSPRIWPPAELSPPRPEPPCEPILMSDDVDKSPCSSKGQRLAAESEVGPALVSIDGRQSSRG